MLELVVAYSKMLSWYQPRETDENTENPYEVVSVLAET